MKKGTRVPAFHREETLYKNKGKHTVASAVDKNPLDTYTNQHADLANAGTLYIFQDGKTWWFVRQE